MTNYLWIHFILDRLITEREMFQSTKLSHLYLVTVVKFESIKWETFPSYTLDIHYTWD